MRSDNLGLELKSVTAPGDLIATETAFITGEELAIAEANYREMKARVEAMGAVNMMALEEFNECEQGFAFLTRERDDLLQTAAVSEWQREQPFGDVLTGQ